MLTVCQCHTSGYWGITQPLSQATGPHGAWGAEPACLTRFPRPPPASTAPAGHLQSDFDRLKRMRKAEQEMTVNMDEDVTGVAGACSGGAAR